MQISGYKEKGLPLFCLILKSYNLHHLSIMQINGYEETGLSLILLYVTS